MRKIFAVLRHGERADCAESQREILVEGDPPLTEKGLRQAEMAANKILDAIENPEGLYLVCSPFLRCIETASKIALKTNTPIHIEEAFSELMRDDYFGPNIFNELNVRQRKEELEKELGVVIIENNHILRPQYTETWRVATRRVRTAWHNFFENAKEYNCVVVISHQFVVDEIINIWKDHSSQNYDEGYCKLAIVSHDKHGYKFIQHPITDYCLNA
ncbi:hypothetical protein SteCoe_7810 [Stentor coeruleus]|uniref:Histidine phosphatase family protein n=1 Tax=Stentor coeruleus TaxID=5963 RepID=A0A1R2CLN0_9CILI|nr:hypothetical protein SteCoe_7810 [Stentor coeruleus]